MSTIRMRTALATVTLMSWMVAAPATAQHRGHLANTPSPHHTAPAVRSDAPSARLALPSIRMGDWGVRSKAPRGIGKVDGSLLPPAPGRLVPRAGAPSNDVQFLPNGGGLVRGRDGRWMTAPWSTGGGSGVSGGPRGFDVAGAASGDTWAIAAALNNSPGHLWLRRHHGGSGFFNGYGYGYGYGNYNLGYPAMFGYDGYYADSFVYYGAPPPDPAAPAVDPEAGLTVPEMAARRMRIGRSDEAIVLLRSYAESHPQDNETARGLAFALIDAKRTKEGVALMALVYERDPGLALVPIASDIVGPDRELRDLVVRVVEYGHRTNTASVWLTAAVLMQTEGREEPALRMLVRAEALGLNADVVKSMRQALKP